MIRGILKVLHELTWFLLAIVIWEGCGQSDDCGRDQVLSSLRDNLEFFGVDVSDLDDDELERHMMQVGTTLAETAHASGISTADAAAALHVLVYLPGYHESLSGATTPQHTPERETRQGATE